MTVATAEKTIDRPDDTGQILRRMVRYMAGGEQQGRFWLALVIRVVGLAGLVALPALTGQAINLLSDPDGTVLDLYGAWKEKTLYGRTFMGTDRTTFLIDEHGTVQKVYRKVRVKGHAQACLLDLR